MLERRKEVAPRLQDFAKDGDLTMMQLIGDDVEDVAAICRQVFASSLDKIGVDPVGLGGILEALRDAGIPDE